MEQLTSRQWKFTTQNRTAGRLWEAWTIVGLEEGLVWWNFHRMIHTSGDDDGLSGTAPYLEWHLSDIQASFCDCRIWGGGGVSVSSLQAVWLLLVRLADLYNEFYFLDFYLQPQKLLVCMPPVYEYFITCHDGKICCFLLLKTKAAVNFAQAEFIFRLKASRLLVSDE